MSWGSKINDLRNSREIFVLYEDFNFAQNYKMLQFNKKSLLPRIQSVHHSQNSRVALIKFSRRSIIVLREWLSDVKHFPWFYLLSFHTSNLAGREHDASAKRIHLPFKTSSIGLLHGELNPLDI